MYIVETIGNVLCGLKTNPIYINVILHVIILFTILSVFFCFEITKTEVNAFQGQINKFGLEITNQLQNYNNPELKTLIQSLPLNIAQELYSKPDPYTVEHNAWIQGCTIFIWISLFILLMVGWASCCYCYNILQYFLENIVIFFFVGIIEVCFFFLIATKYQPVAPSTMVTTIFNTIRKNLQN
jgi:hypothetical protein